MAYFKRFSTLKFKISPVLFPAGLLGVFIYSFFIPGFISAKDSIFPSITNIAVLQTSFTENQPYAVAITAHVTSVYGIKNVEAVIKDSRDTVIGRAFLFDDGKHSDGNAGDELFGGISSSRSYYPGVYQVQVKATGGNGGQLSEVKVNAFTVRAVEGSSLTTTTTTISNLPPACKTLYQSIKDNRNATCSDSAGLPFLPADINKDGVIDTTDEVDFVSGYLLKGESYCKQKLADTTDSCEGFFTKELFFRPGKGSRQGLNLISWPQKEGISRKKVDNQCKASVRQTYSGQDTQHLKAGEAYWLDVPQTCTLYQGGTPWNFDTIELQPKKWKTIGAPYNEVSLFGVKGDCDLSKLLLYESDNSLSLLKAADKLRPGYGYYAMNIADTSCTLQYPFCGDILSTLQKGFGKTCSAQEYSPVADMNDDKVINVLDLIRYFQGDTATCRAQTQKQNICNRPSPCGDIGDIDEDGQITRKDIDLIQNAVAEKIILSTDAGQRADVNGDGEISAADQALVGEYMEGAAGDFPACYPQPPDTTITSSPSTSASSSVSFSFESTVPNSTFRCRLDYEEFAPCVSPKTYDSLEYGPHTFEVKAVSPFSGIEDSTPASHSWAVIPEGDTFGEQKTAVILVNFEDDTSEPWTKEYVRDFIFDGAESVNAFYQEVSYNQAWLTGDVFGWYTLPILSKSAKCNYSNLQDKAIEAADSDIYFPDYSRIIIAFPYIPSCGWSGLGYIGKILLMSRDSSSGFRASVSWINASMQSTAHELGHNFGVMHASSYRCHPQVIGENCTRREYGDPFSVMGSGRTSHFNAPHKEALGWLPPPMIKEVTADGVYGIEPIETATRGVKFLKVPRRLPYSDSDGDDTLSDWFFLEHRQPIGFDERAWAIKNNPDIANGVLAHFKSSLIHSGGRTLLLDMTPETTTFFDGALRMGRTFVEKIVGGIGGASIEPLQKTDGGIDVRISMPSPPPPCERANPTAQMVFHSRLGSATISFSVFIENNDEFCTRASTFEISLEAPEEWAHNLLRNGQTMEQVSLLPGKKETNITGWVWPVYGVQLEPGTYDFTFTATNIDNPSLTSSATVTYEVAP